jgi:hypothetical protein
MLQRYALSFNDTSFSEKSFPELMNFNDSAQSWIDFADF